MNFSIFLFVFAALYCTCVSSKLADCINRCNRMSTRRQLWCKYECFKEYTFGGFRMGTRAECYRVCDRIPSATREDCRTSCDCLFLYDAVADYPPQNRLPFQGHFQQFVLDSHPGALSRNDQVCPSLYGQPRNSLVNGQAGPSLVNGQAGPSSAQEYSDESSAYGHLAASSADNHPALSPLYSISEEGPTTSSSA